MWLSDRRPGFFELPFRPGQTAAVHVFLGQVPLNVTDIQHGGPNPKVASCRALLLGAGAWR